MDKTFAKDAFFWGFVLFFVVPKEMIGWILNPIGILITLWVLSRKIEGASLGYFLRLAAVWTLIAIVLDYIFNVQLFRIGSGYYQPDVCLYYALTLGLPIAYWQAEKRRK